MKKVLILAGSLREGSFNKLLAKGVKENFSDIFNFEIFSNFEKIPHYNADDQQKDGFPDIINQLGKKIRDSHGVLVVTPEYNYSIPGYLKNTLDWLSRLKENPFSGKPLCIQSASLGPLGGARVQYHLRQVLVFLDAKVMNKPEIFVTFAASKFDEKTGKINDETTLNFIKNQMIAFDKFIN